LPNSLSRKGLNLALLNLNIKLYGVTTHLAVFDKFLFRYRSINPFKLFLPTMGARKKLLDHGGKVKVMGYIKSSVWGCIIIMQSF
jgi:hypothetical protein